jgi:gliding motility-associated-like protein
VNISFDKIHALGDCENWINIECSSQSGTASFTVNTPNQSAYIRFRDISISGSTWTVNPHIKIGTVAGISGNQYQGKKMYWVGGSGKWNDPIHWSLTDGGPPVSCIPGPLDTLYFTDNSGTTTTIVDFGDSVVQFHSLFASNQSLQIIFSGTNQPLQAMGSFVFTPNSNWNVAKNVALYGTDTTYIIESNGNSFQRLSVIGGGTWSVVDTFNAGMLSIMHGHFVASDKVLNLGSLEDDEDEWPFYSSTSSNDFPELSIDSGLVNISSRVELSNNNFSLDAYGSRVNCDQGVYFYTVNAQLQWNIVEWISNFGVARIEGSLKRIRQLILNSETESPADLLMDTLTVIKGNTYKLGNSVKFLKINALGECNKRIIFRPYGSITNWDGLNQINNVYYSLFEDVAFTNGTLNAYNSFDLSGNSGINFIAGLSRTLYWVGGNGEWDDSTHWSLSSGGLGGECIPTPADSVIFDDNSSTGNMTVDLATTAFARDLMMFNSAFELTFDESTNITPSSHIEIYGNVQFSSELNYQYNRELVLKPDSGNFIFKTNDSYAYWLDQVGTATYTLIDTLKLNRFYRSAGIFNCDTNHVEVYYMYNNGGDFFNTSTTMEFTYLNSYANFEYPFCDVTILEDAYISGQVNSLSAKLLFTSTWPDFVTSSTDTISKVIFINPLGKAQVSVINSHLGYLQFNGWAYLNRSTSTDTCIMTNGNSYFFSPSYNHHVYKYWDVDGDFCNPILLRSQTQGVQAPVYSSDTVGGDFLEIRDLNFSGPSVFYSGLHSVDQGNNSGFIWNNRPGYIWGLGPDRFFLECDSANPTGTLLTTENFQDAAGYVWSYGSTGDSLLVNASGTYWCTADYITCQVTDTIEVTFSTVILDVKDSTVYCTPKTINLILVDTSVEDRYTFLWNTGATTNGITFSFYQDTTLWYTISDTLGVVCTDTIHLYLLDYDYSPKDLNVLNCAQGSLEQLVYQYLQIPTPDSSLFDWSAFDSVNNSYYDVLRFTLYFDGCEVIDSINLRYDNPFPIIPNDSLLCEGSTVTFRVDKPIPAFSYLWSTGESTLTISRVINTNGQVYLVVTDDLGQTCSDTVNYKMGNPVKAMAKPKFAQGIQPFEPEFVGTKIQADYSYWMFSGDTLNTGDTLLHVFIQPGNYEVYYYALNTNTGCFDIDTVWIEVTENAIAWIPSAFSPNGDGTNDVWEFTIGLHIKGPVHLQVYSRWGDMLFETRDRHVRWDGYYRGKRVQQDAYVYVLLYGSEVTPRMIHGTVVVID